MTTPPPVLPTEVAAIAPVADSEPAVQSEKHTVVDGGKDGIPNDESSGWLPAIDAPPAETHTNGLAKSPSVTATTRLNGHARSTSASPRRSGSLSRKSQFTNAEGQAVEGSAFITGAAMTGPNSAVEQSEQLVQRAADADASLTEKQRSKIAKAEAKDGKRLSKVIKQEAKAEKEALNTAIKELAQLQKLQNVAVKSEAKAASAHTKALAEFQKQEALFLAARTKYESTQAKLHAEEETLEIVRNNARDATERLQEKSQEVDSLRTMYGVDERERAAKLSEIAANSAKFKGRFW